MRLARLVLYILPFAIASLCWAGDSGFVEPDSPTGLSDDGTVQLAWAAADGVDVTYQVHRSGSGDFGESVLVYEGKDTATFVSGLPEGEFHFKVRSKTINGGYPDWPDDALVLKVEYIDSSLVALLMSAGFITFLAIVGAIIVGNRRAGAQEIEAGS